jgi:magnesium chelatase family protein
MYIKLKTATNIGLTGYPTDVEVHISRGLPSFKIVGLPDKAIGEAKERVKAAIKSSGYTFPLKRIIVNLAPSNIPKFGSAFDLPIALGIILLNEEFNPANLLSKTMFLGELGLDGVLKAVKGIPIAIEAAISSKVASLVIPSDPSRTYDFTHNKNVNIYTAETINECVGFLKQEIELPLSVCSDRLTQSTGNDIPTIHTFKGSKSLIRALKIAAAGRHHLMLQGPPGCGKSLLARSLKDLMPIPSKEDFYEISKIYSITNEKLPPLQAPFRAPHSSISTTAMIGGGRHPTPGEISLAHRGVLFLDELPQFDKRTINALRQPLENKYISLSRKDYNCSLPSDFQLVAAMNRCPCGMLGHPHPQKQCSCTPSQIARYSNKVPKALQDRIDMILDIRPNKFDDLVDNRKKIDLENLRKQVIAAQDIGGITSKNRRNDKKPQSGENPQSGEENFTIYKKFLTSKARSLIQDYYNKKGISARKLIKILRISKTIAALQNRKEISENNIAEAISYQPEKSNQK